MHWRRVLIFAGGHDHLGSYWRDPHYVLEAVKRCILSIILLFLGGSLRAQSASNCPWLSQAQGKQERDLAVYCDEFRGKKFVVARARTGHKLRAEMYSAKHKSPLSSFTSDREVMVVTNGGIYKDEGDGTEAPEGLLIRNGNQVASLNLQSSNSSSPSNFYWKPNGVFWIDLKGKPHITEAAEFKQADISKVREATQSGPLLVSRDKLHSGFATSKTEYVRNGVGVRDGTLYLVVSREPVRMEELAWLFREKLGCPNALYLDGAISEMYVRSGNTANVGLSVVEPEGALRSSFVTMIGLVRSR